MKGLRRVLSRNRPAVDLTAQGDSPIWLMPEYSAPPLWTRRGPTTPEALGLSPDLCAAIWAWAYEYDHDGPNNDRWPDDEAYGAEGLRLAARASDELGRPVLYDD